MKRLLTLAAVFLCSLLTFAQFGGSGSGTESDPYLILNPIQLNQLRNYLNKEGVYFKLMTDIDLTEYLEDESPSQGWQPVGTSSTPFKGILDGNGKTISGFWIDRINTDYVGLFGNLTGGTVKNLKLKGNSVKGKDYVGFLAGKGGAIGNCSFYGCVIGSSYVGGCIGSGGTFSNCYSTINVEGSGDYVGGFSGQDGTFQGCKLSNSYIKGRNYVGGICGANINQVVSSYAYADITGIDYVGGVCGQATNRSNIINGCGFWGRIDANSKVGGIAGEYTHGSSYSKYDKPNPTLINSFAIADIICSGDNIGGIVGFTDADQHYGGALHKEYYTYYVNKIAHCYYSGNLKGCQNVGGIVGYKLGGSIESCYSKASISGSKNVGGICGSMSIYGIAELISNISNVLSIKSTEGGVGRLYGNISGVSIGEIGTSKENKAFNRCIVINAGVAQDITDDEQNGTGVSATTLKLKATYVAMGWDFTDVWEIQESECYPYMKSQTAPPVITSQLVSGATTVSGKCVDGGVVTIDIDGVTQQMTSTGNEFSFNVNPLQAGHEVRISAKAEGKEQSYYTTEMVAYKGKGTEADPYQVYTASDLTGVYRKGYFKLMNDIDLTSYINQFSPSEGWESIGREGSETIHFDGNGHKITGLWCNSTRNNTGLFSCFANGTIKNLTVETSKGKQVKGGANTGILIGKMINGTIENCRVSGTVADGTPVGGLVGLFDGGKISLSQANITINTTGEKSYVGGLVGEITGGEIDQCVTLGTVTATGKESYVGGLVGKNSATVTNCYSNANVTSTYNAAGLIAYNYSVVDKCYATGNIFSNNYGAGVIGYNDGENAVVKNSAAMNNKIDVIWESQQEQQSGGYGQRIIGGIKNSAPAPELNNYALKTMQVSVNNNPQKVYDDIMNGVGKNGSDLAKANTYQELGWNFSTIWTITEGESYPSLKNNAANVLKPGEDPDPGEDPEPEPILSTDDQIVIGEVSGSKGKTTTLAIELNNKTTTLSAYQFDLKLPAGFTLSKNDKGKFQVSKTNRYEDESQTLNVSAVEGSSNTYRFVCFSLSNSVIEGTSGAILNAIIDAASTVEPGSYEGQISNIVFTKADGTQVKLNSVKFNIVVNNVTKGDVNDDGEINVSDIVEIVNYIMGKPSAKFVEAAADLNEDGEVNVTDIVKVVTIIMSANNARHRASVVESIDNDRLTLVENENHALSLCLNNESSYVASQFDIHLSDGQTLESIMLNSIRSKDHVMTYTKTNDDTYRVIVYSLGNQAYTGNNGELLSIQVSGTGNVDIDNILFVTSGQNEKRFASLHSYTTGINAVKEIKDMDVYSIDGRLVRKQVNSTNDLKKGIYIINGKKHIVR